MTITVRSARNARRGFALLTVLWVMVGASLLAVQVERATHEALGTARNRMDALRATWIAEGCLATVRANIGQALATAVESDQAWSALPADLVRERTSHCELTVEAAGTVLDVNASNAPQLRTLLLAAGQSYERADSLADAIADWMDADDSPRPNGAERAWYVANGRVPPRNAAIESREELHHVRGWNKGDGLDSLLGIEPGRVLLTRAPLAVLLSLPGFGPEAAARTLELRERGNMSLLTLAAALSDEARARLSDSLLILQRTTTLSPDAWVVTASVVAPHSRVRSAIEVTLVRAGRRVAVTRHRSYPWT